MNNAITEIKSALKGANSRVTEAEDRISEVDDRKVEIKKEERKKGKKKELKEVRITRDLWDNVKCPNIQIIGVPEEEDKKKRHEKILEIIIENIPKMGKEIATQVQETQSPKQDKSKVKHLKTHINQITKDQTQRTNIKSNKKKQQITHKGIPIRIIADLSKETLRTRREWQDILKVMKEKNLQPRLLYPTRISFKYEGEIKSFTDKQKLREFSTTKPALQQILKDIL